MKIWTWKRLMVMFGKYPDLRAKYQELPCDYGTFDEWLFVDAKKCDIVAEVIGCRNAVSIKAQQKEAMAWRQSAAPDPKAWICRYSNVREYSTRIDQLTRSFMRRKLCHRNWSGSRAGIRCYCK